MRWTYLVLCQKDSFRYAFAFGKAKGQSKTALNRAISPSMYRLEKFGGLRLAGVPERQSKAFDFFVSREPFLVSAFAFEQFKLLVKQRLIRFERQRRLETAAIPASSRKVECCSKQQAICPIEEDLSRSTHGIKSIITSDWHQQLRLSSAIVFAENSGVAPA